MQISLNCLAVGLALFAFNTVVERMLKDVKDQRGKVETERSNTFALEAIAVALKAPVNVLLPIVASMVCLKDVCRMVFTLHPEWYAPLAPFLKLAGKAITQAERFAMRYSELLAVVIVTWLLVSAKKALFNKACDAIASAEGVDSPEIERALNPLSDLISWVIGAGALAVSAAVLGINVQPVLVTGGIGGAIAALASQSFLANIVSGVNLFLSRPFVVGDRIMVEGSVKVKGTVEAVTYTRTLVRLDNLLPVLVPNKALQDAVIINESRAGNSVYRSNYFGPRQLTFTFQMPFKHMEVAPQITAEIRRWAREECDLVDNRYALYAWVTDLKPNSATVTVNLYSTTRGSRAFAAFREEVLSNVVRIVGEYGAAIVDYSALVSWTQPLSRGEGQMAPPRDGAPWQALMPGESAHVNGKGPNGHNGFNGMPGGASSSKGMSMI